MLLQQRNLHQHTTVPILQTPSILSWKVQADSANIYNTPNIFSIWALECITADLLAKGGLVTAGDRARRRAELVIQACMSRINAELALAWCCVLLEHGQRGLHPHVHLLCCCMQLLEYGAGGQSVVVS